ncbi:hypothetical protein [Amycolatopsis minnesotensis]|uniref:Uncharacterized protein n=1 Tax=Amycolatopsis minnesotensis TaxID=337894 RepID=A0ABN2S7U9_9PSEU
MADKTEFDKDELKNSAKEIAKLLGDGRQDKVDKLVNQHPKCGIFNLAVWVERLTDDRRNAVVAHFNHLGTSFEKMSDFLNEIAEKFDNVDGDNASKIKKIINDEKDDSEKKIKEWNTAREKTEGNHGGGGGSRNDGYTNNLNVEFKSDGSDEVDVNKKN